MNGVTECGVARATPVQSLVDVLEEELGLLLRIKELARRQSSILSPGRPDALWELLSDLEKCWQDLRCAEGRRQRIARQLSEETGSAGAGASLTEVISALPSEAGAPMQRLQAALSTATAEVTALNAQNAALIAGFLQVTGQRLQFYTALQKGYQPYDASGRRAMGASSTLQGARLA